MGVSLPIPPLSMTLFISLAPTATLHFQVKELGLLTSNCSCLGTDMSKIFDIYWMLAEPSSTIPKHWPRDLDTYYNKGNIKDFVVNNN